MIPFFLADGTSLIKAHPEADNLKHRPPESGPKHQQASKPTWLLALEVGTGVMVGSVFLVALLTAFQRCNSKSSIIIPWKKSPSEKDNVAVYVGQFPYLSSSMVDTELLKDAIFQKNY